MFSGASELKGLPVVVAFFRRAARFIISHRFAVLRRSIHSVFVRVSEPAFHISINGMYLNTFIAC